MPYDSGRFTDYTNKLKTMASFSRLFSTSKTPFIHYRVTENLYADCLKARNVSRKDCTADAIYEKTGVGIKTFVDNPLQKIAEFNDLRPKYSSLHGKELAEAISEYRNCRIETTMRSYGLVKMIYHYIVREPGKVKLFECPMNSIDIKRIRIIKETTKKIVFTDGIEEYEFMFSKSTLFKRFSLSKPFYEFNISIISDPIKALEGYLSGTKTSIVEDKVFGLPVEKNQLIIPLYSETNKGGCIIYPKSGLNIWNARGRKRDPNEVYIPYPAKIKKQHPNFFPPRDVKWDLCLPNGKHISMKICQDNEKAIMSDPNKALGKWLLRDVLNLPEGQILTYDHLLKVGINSVIFTKEDKTHFSVDFLEFDE